MPIYQTTLKIMGHNIRDFFKDGLIVSMPLPFLIKIVLVCSYLGH